MNRIQREQRLSQRQPCELAMPGYGKENEIQKDQYQNAQHNACHHGDVRAAI